MQRYIICKEGHTIIFPKKPGEQLKQETKEDQQLSLMEHQRLLATNEIVLHHLSTSPSFLLYVPIFLIPYASYLAFHTSLSLYLLSASSLSLTLPLLLSPLLPSPQTVICML